jgi:hypothetical protein
MPASTSSFVVSTSVYLLSSAIFLGIAYTPIQSSIRGTETMTVKSVADGLKLQLDSLSSGGTATLVWRQQSAILQVPVSVTIDDHSITASFRDIVETRHVRWILPSMLLSPGQTYVATVQGDRVNILETTKSLG